MTTRPICARLREDVLLEVVYDDRTPFGSGFTGLNDRLLQRSCEPLRKAVAADGWPSVLARAEDWMRRIMAPQALGALYRKPGELRETCLYPPAHDVRPAALRIAVPRGDRHATTIVALTEPLLGSLARWLGDWQRGASRPRAPHAAALWDRLEALGAFETPRPAVSALADGVTFIGHATVAVQAQGSQLLFDPYLVPPSSADPPQLRPHTPCDLRPTAIFITHSHHDHFDVDTLLRFPADTPIYVPPVARESLLATDMALRLRQLGFTRVRELEWGGEVHDGPFCIRALPFYGEQPTDGRPLHPEARNVGNTYVVEGLGRSIALVADAGRDAAGSTIEMAAEARRRHGPLDVLFGGFRAWRIQPIRFIGTSVARYVLFVPPGECTRVQQIMNDAEDFVATGQAWGARAIVPYANGGAPWFARVGLGPHGTVDNPDDDDFDPSLDEVRRAMAAAAPTDVALQVMTTGQCSHAFEAGPA
ncbi:MAG TPA: MBL fold metallo-hydrolase [Nannocystaceae bacterium]|nr:MBL fold metallo-hydrolase [Nannocystaceae bacterium]